MMLKLKANKYFRSDYRLENLLETTHKSCQIKNVSIYCSLIKHIKPTQIQCTVCILSKLCQRVSSYHPGWDGCTTPATTIPTSGTKEYVQSAKANIWSSSYAEGGNLACSKQTESAPNLMNCEAQNDSTQTSAVKRKALPNNEFFFFLVG